MPKGKIGFEQLNENLKQKIELGGSGGGGGVGFLKNTVVVTSSTNTVKIGLQFEPGTDALLVFKNSTYQELEHDYTIDETGKYIKTTSGQWIASNEAPVTFNFIVLRTVPLANSIASNTGAVGFIRKTILVEQDTNEIELDLMYNKVTDAILVFRNSVLIEAEEDYTIDMDRQVLINPNANWVAGTLLNLMVFKSVPVEDVKFDGEIIEDGTISIDKLSPEFNVLINNLVQDFETSMVQINQDIKNLENTMNNTINNSMANMQVQINDMEVLLASKQNKTDNSLKTSNKNIVGAINEVFQYANDGKSSIASAIVGKGGNANTAMTFAQLSTAIKNLPTKSDAYADLSALFRFDESMTKAEIDSILNMCTINPWSDVKEFSGARFIADNGIIGHRIFYFGGANSSYDEYSYVKCFNADAESWSTVSPLPYETVDSIFTRCPSGDYLMGKTLWNSRGDASYYGNCAKLNANETWSSIASMPIFAESMGFAYNYENNTIFAAGGYQVTPKIVYRYYQTLFEYNVALGTWTTHVSNGYEADDKKVYHDRSNCLYYKDGRLYNLKGECQIQVSDKAFATEGQYPNVVVPASHKTMVEAGMIDGSNNRYYKSEKNIRCKNYTTNTVTSLSKFSTLRSGTYISNSSATFLYAVSKSSDTYSVSKLDKFLDDHLAI